MIYVRVASDGMVDVCNNTLHRGSVCRVRVWVSVEVPRASGRAGLVYAGLIQQKSIFYSGVGLCWLGHTGRGSSNGGGRYNGRG